MARGGIRPASHFDAKTMRFAGLNVVCGGQCLSVRPGGLLPAGTRRATWGQRVGVRGHFLAVLIWGHVLDMLGGPGVPAGGWHLSTMIDAGRHCPGSVLRRGQQEEDGERLSMVTWGSGGSTGLGRTGASALHLEHETLPPMTVSFLQVEARVRPGRVAVRAGAEAGRGTNEGDKGT